MKIKNSSSVITVLLFLASFLGCASEQHSFEHDVRVGMDKAEVLEAVGGPSATRRRNGEDVWQYDFYNGEQKTVKELRFKNDKVSYKGDPVQPKPGETAKDIDKKNAKYAPSFSSLPMPEEDGLTPEQRREKLKDRLKEDVGDGKKSNFKDL